MAGCDDTAMTYTDRIRAAREYYALCDRAEAKGVPVSLDDPRTPRTVAELRRAAA